MLLPLMMAVAAMEPVVDPVWISRPNGEQIAAVYPRAAVSEQLSGYVVFNCTMNEDGRPTNCAVESEKPTGLGFVQAGLTLSKGFHARAAQNDGSLIVGRPFRLPIRFVPPTTPVEPIMISRPAGPAGRVVLNCRTDSDARLDNCFVASEPGGSDLGQAALTLVNEVNSARPPSTRKRQSFARIALPIVFTGP